MNGIVLGAPSVIPDQHLGALRVRMNLHRDLTISRSSLFQYELRL